MPDVPMRTCEIDYIGGGTSEDWFDDVLDVFERHGLSIEACMDAPTGEVGWTYDAPVVELNPDKMPPGSFTPGPLPDDVPPSARRTVIPVEDDDAALIQLHSYEGEDEVW